MRRIQEIDSYLRTFPEIAVLRFKKINIIVILFEHYQQRNIGKDKEKNSFESYQQRNIGKDKDKNSFEPIAGKVISAL